MATIAIMIAGAVLNATAFVGGSYLAKHVDKSGSASASALLAERKRHDKALEKYQADWAAFQERRQKLEDWEVEQERIRRRTGEDINATNRALALYAQTHPRPPSAAEPQWADYYRPSSAQRTGELVYVGGGMLAAGYAASRWL